MKVLKNELEKKLDTASATTAALQALELQVSNTKKEEATQASGFSDTRKLRQGLTELEQIEQKRHHL